DAKVNVIAAANPRNFRWEFLTVDEIPIPLVLLTRFHLIIPLGPLDSKYYPDVAENFSDEAKSKFEDSMKGFKEFVERCREMDVMISKRMSKYAGVFFQKMKEKGLDESFPITPRQIEGFINLSKAVARVYGKGSVDKVCLVKTAEIFTDVVANYMFLAEQLGIKVRRLKEFVERRFM
ncbi:hypothetical protein J7L49_04875, partial [Candidatus Bathyarchaeota archaeon]|nr:hypothetical protein [Candidatus Bathyarchaeota archaeon]